MNQSTIIFGYLAVAFLIFIVQRGELPTYWGLLTKSPQGVSSGPQANPTGAVSGSSMSTSVANIGTAATALERIGTAFSAFGL